MSEAPQVVESTTPVDPSASLSSDMKLSLGDAEAPSEQVVEAVEGEEPDAQDVDAELEDMKRRLAQMEAESGIAKDDEGSSTPSAPNGAAEADGALGAAASTGLTTESAGEPARIPLSVESVADADARSIYVGNVDYSATVDQLSAHFADCGTINRVTIMCNKATGQPKGFAYIEFQEHLAAQNALILDESTFLGRALKVVPKRTNIPNAYRGGYRGRPRFSRGGRGFSRRPRRSWRGRWSPY